MGESVPCGLCGKLADCDCVTRPLHETTKLDCLRCGTFLAWLIWLQNVETGGWQRCIDIPAYYSRSPMEALRYYVSAGNKKQLEKGLPTVRARPGGLLVGEDVDIPRAILTGRDLPFMIACWNCENEQIFRRNPAELPGPRKRSTIDPT